MDFIENHQGALLRRKVMLGVGEPRKIRGHLKVQVNRSPSARLRQCPGERGLAGLARTEQRHRGELPEQRLDLRQRGTGDEIVSTYHAFLPWRGRFAMLSGGGHRVSRDIA